MDCELAVRRGRCLYCGLTFRKRGLANHQKHCSERPALHSASRLNLNAPFWESLVFSPFRCLWLLFLSWLALQIIISLLEQFVVTKFDVLLAAFLKKYVKVYADIVRMIKAEGLDANATANGSPKA